MPDPVLTMYWLISLLEALAFVIGIFLPIKPALRGEVTCPRLHG